MCVSVSRPHEVNCYSNMSQFCSSGSALLSRLNEDPRGHLNPRPRAAGVGSEQ